MYKTSVLTEVFFVLQLNSAFDIIILIKHIKSQFVVCWRQKDVEKILLL